MNAGIPTASAIPITADIRVEVTDAGIRIGERCWRCNGRANMRTNPPPPRPVCCSCAWSEFERAVGWQPA